MSASSPDQRALTARSRRPRHERSEVRPSPAPRVGTKHGLGRLLIIAATTLALTGVAVPAAVSATSGSSVPRTAELSETTRLPDRRAVVSGDRAYAVSSEDGLYPAMGWHINGEMGGIWSPPIKLLDGLWFGVDGAWLGADAGARRFTSGWGYTRTDYQRTDGVQVSRTDVVPDGQRSLLVGLTLKSDRNRTVPLTVDAHSELMAAYPWGSTTPSQADVNVQDEGATERGRLVFTESADATNPIGAHDWAAVVAGSLRPSSTSLGPNHRGPQDPAVVCPTTGTLPPKCDDSGFGKGTGGQLTYELRLTSGHPTTIWFAVAGSDEGAAAAHQTASTVLKNPAGLLQKKVRARQAIDARSKVVLPGDRLLAESIAWSKQNLADSAQQSDHVTLRWTDEGKTLQTVGELDSMRWLGAGWPDYPWVFGTDGEYTSYASVAMGDFENIQAHLRTLRDISDQLNDRSGKVAHEITPDGSIYYGANSSAGNTDETSKFPSAVATVWRWSGDDEFRDEMYDFTKRNMQYVVTVLDEDGDGWPEGLGNVEREGMGAEKLDNTVYTIRGLRDLADLATSTGDTATATWATERATAMEAAFDAAWWFGGDAHQYADSLENPGNTKVFQRHWTGVTPMDAVLVKPDGTASPLAPSDHAREALSQREKDCYTGNFGLYHTGTGPTSAPAGNPGSSCDSVVSAVPSERSEFSLNTAIMAVGEGNYGRLGAGQQQVYTTANARIQLDRSVWEQPGAMPEIAPDGDFIPNIDRSMMERSMVLQAWGAYGNLWPVIHQQLGVSPDLGRDRVAVVPLVPEGAPYIKGSDIRLGERGKVTVRAARTDSQLTTTIDLRSTGTKLTIGHTLRADEHVASVRLDGKKRTDYEIVTTERGRELRLPTGSGHHTLAIALK